MLHGVEVSMGILGGHEWQKGQRALLRSGRWRGVWCCSSTQHPHWSGSSPPTRSALPKLGCRYPRQECIDIRVHIAAFPSLPTLNILAGVLQPVGLAPCARSFLVTGRMRIPAIRTGNSHLTTLLLESLLGFVIALALRAIPTRPCLVGGHSLGGVLARVHCMCM